MSESQLERVVPTYSKRHYQAVIAVLLALCSAAAAYIYFSNFPSKQAKLYGIAINAFAFLIALAFFALYPALHQRTYKTILVAKVHAALYTAFVFITIAASQRPFPIIDIILITALGGELLILGMAVAKARELKPVPVVVPWIFSGLIAALVGGWGFGLLAWAVQIPAQVIAAAEEIAQDYPYCIDVSGRAAQSRLDLTGVMMFTRDQYGWSPNFHALLVIDRGSDRSYFNWSYKKGGFQPIDDGTRRNLGLGTYNPIRCKPVQHFARDWL